MFVFAAVVVVIRSGVAIDVKNWCHVENRHAHNEVIDVNYVLRILGVKLGIVFDGKKFKKTKKHFINLILLKLLISYKWIGLPHSVQKH